MSETFTPVTLIDRHDAGLVCARDVGRRYNDFAGCALAYSDGCDARRTYVTTNPHTGERRCSVCERWQPLDRFHRDNRDGLGRRGSCKDCTCAYHRARYADPDVRIADIRDGIRATGAA